jgi:hypothetical protein
MTGRLRIGKTSHWLLIATCFVVCLALVGITISPGVRSGRLNAVPLTAAGSIRPTVASYLITFQETGLAAGTSWNISLWPTNSNEATSSSSEMSATDTIQFTEPNGSYTYAPSQTAGFTTSPQGNTTVAGSSQLVTISYANVTQSNSPTVWSSANYSLTVLSPGWYVATYSANIASIGWVSEWTSVRIAALAEIDPSGTIVAVSGQPSPLNSTVVYGYAPPDGTNVTNAFTVSVGPAIGLNSSTGTPDGHAPQWNSSYLPGGGGSTMWGVGSGPTHPVMVAVTFQFANGTHPNEVKFDVSVSGWSWVAADDTLGIAVESVSAASPGGSHFTYDLSADAFTDWWNSNGTAISSMSFGRDANATSSPAGPLSVADSGGVYWGGEMALALLSFTGAGGYANMSYDPWIYFGTAATTPEPVPVVAAPGSIPIVDLGATAILAVIGGSLLVLYSRRARRHPIEEGLRPVS